MTMDKSKVSYNININDEHLNLGQNYDCVDNIIGDNAYRTY